MGTQIGTHFAKQRDLILRVIHVAISFAIEEHDPTVNPRLHGYQRQVGGLLHCSTLSKELLRAFVLEREGPFLQVSRVKVTYSLYEGLRYVTLLPIPEKC